MSLLSSWFESAKSFLRDRALLGVIVLVMFATTLMQTGISYTLVVAGLHGLVSADRILIGSILMVLRIGSLAVLVVFWILNIKGALFLAIVIYNCILTLFLLFHMNSIVSVLLGSAIVPGNALIADATLMLLSNVLVFSMWYWIADPPGVQEDRAAGRPWDFLFPQRGSSLPGYETWAPHYLDYLFLAFTTSFAFSPTDTLPLTARAKMLMMLQAAISVVTLTGIAGSAINLLAGK
jgi:hypothetical protein